MLLREGGSRAAASWGRSTPVHGAARARKGWGSTSRFGARLPASRPPASAAGGGRAHALRGGTGTAPRTEGRGAALVPWAELFPTGRKGSWSPPLPPSLCPPSPFVRSPLFYVPLRIPVPHQGWCRTQPTRMWGRGGFLPLHPLGGGTQSWCLARRAGLVAPAERGLPQPPGFGTGSSSCCRDWGSGWHRGTAEPWVCVG